ncbi:glycosyltransferase [Actinoplanes philippinensis]|uniref:glycosyltransferase n=1 Tax=Actinoplanes philippinensis TaxID=35752 RepID=UPI001C431E81|nr:glycosyltransferase [Actinoplanes philippinensis]
MSVVIPLTSLSRLPLLFAGLPPVGEIIVVVGPGDDTVLPLPRAARVIRQTRHGAGNAIACGVAAATGDVIVTLPGDGSCDPSELPRLVEALAPAPHQQFLPGADRPSAPGLPLASGSGRPAAPGLPFRSGRPAAPGLPFRSGRPAGPGGGRFSDTDEGSLSVAGAEVAEGVRAARRSDLILLWFMSVLLGCRPSGPGTGFRAFRRENAGLLGLPPVAGTDPAHGDGRDIEPLLAARSRAAGLRLAEVPVSHYPQIGRGIFLPGLAAIIRERLTRRRAPHTSGEESIVVLTGGPSYRPSGSSAHRATGGSSHRSPGGPSHLSADDAFSRPRWSTSSRTESGASSPSALGPYFAGPVNAPRKPATGHRPTDPAVRRWPAPNRIAAAATDRPNSVATDHPNSAGIGVAERRRGGDRRGPERRRADTTPDRRSATGRPGNDRPNADSPIRRRWRESQTDLNLGRRPDLRVINGEGSGSGGARGHLRSV